jgi:hypothetical protein
MTLNYKTILINLILIYCFLLTIPLLVSWILPSAIGGAWKQFFWGIFAIYSFKYTKFNDTKLVYFLLVPFIIVSFVFSIINGINLYRYLYSVWMYIMPVPFYIILIRLNISKYVFLPSLIFLIYFFFYFFLLFDGIYNIDNFLSFNRVISGQDRNISAYFRAQSFFEGANGFMFFFLSGIVISDNYLKNSFAKYFYFFFIIAAGFLTGTRLLIICSVFLIFIFSIKKLYYSIPVVIVLAYFISTYFSNIDSDMISNIGIVDRIFNESDESTRFNQYKAGISNFKNVLSFNFYFGNGVGSSNDNGTIKGDLVLPHFESSTFTLFSELGIFIWYIPILLNLTFLYKLKNFAKKHVFLLLMFFMILVGTLTPTMFHYTSTAALILSYLYFKSSFIILSNVKLDKRLVETDNICT